MSFEIPQNIPVRKALAQLEEQLKQQQRLKLLQRILSEEKHKAFQQLCRLVRVQEESCFADYSEDIEARLKTLTEKEVKGGKK